MAHAETKQDVKMMKSENSDSRQITYSKLFWLFMVGSVFGVILEGFWCLAIYGEWETHVVSVCGPFCIIYGFGMAGCYIGAVLLKNKNIIIRFLAFAFIGAAIELICGFLLEFGLGMKAWDYGDSFLSIRGYVNFLMTVLWGILGVTFGYSVPFVDRIFSKMQGKGWRIACLCLSVFMAVNLGITAVCIVRWKNRHEGKPASNAVEQKIDEVFDDEWMQDRFCEWKFIEN